MRASVFFQFIFSVIIVNTHFGICYAQSNSCFDNYQQKAIDLGKTKHLEPKYYVSQLDSLNQLAKKSNCRSATSYLETLILVDNLKNGSLNLSQLESLLDSLKTELKGKTTIEYNITNATLLSIECHLQVNGFVIYAQNKIEIYKNVIDSFNLPKKDLSRAYLNLFTLYPKINPKDADLDLLFEEGIRHFEEFDTMKLPDAYRRIGQFFINAKKNYKKGAENLIKAKSLMPVSDANYGKLILDLSKLMLQLRMYDKIIDLNQEIEINHIGIRERIQFHSIVANAAFEVNKNKLGFSELEKSKDLTDQFPLYSNFLRTINIFSNLDKLEKRKDFNTAFQLLEDEYYRPCLKDNQAYEGFETIVFHHLMRIEDSLQIESYHSTYNNHKKVAESLSTVSTYPFPSNDLLLQELNWLKENTNVKDKKELENIKEKSLELLTEINDNEAVAYLLNQELEAIKQKKESLLKSESRNYKTIKILALILSFIAAYLLILYRRNSKMQKEKTDLILLNEMIKNRAKYFKTEQQKLKQNFQYIAHDIRGPLQRLNRLQRRLLNSKSQKEINKIRSQSENISESISTMLDELNINLSEDSILDTETKSEINLEELIKESELLIDSALARPYNINIKGSGIVNSYKNSLLILFKNFLENTFKYNLSQALKIEIISEIDSENLRFQFIDYKQIDSNNRPSAKKGFGLGMKICEKIVDKHKGWIKQTNYPNKHIVEVYLR